MKNIQPNKVIQHSTNTEPQKIIQGFLTIFNGDNFGSDAFHGDIYFSGAKFLYICYSM